MKAGFTTLAKALSICLFLGLLSGYVYYRADQRKKAEEREQAAEQAIHEARKKQALADVAEIEAAIAAEKELMSSSKSMIVMPSSKIGTIELSDEDLQRMLKEAEEENANQDEPEKKRIILPSSKRADPLFIPEPQPQQQK